MLLHVTRRTHKRFIWRQSWLALEELFLTRKIFKNCILGNYNTPSRKDALVTSSSSPNNNDDNNSNSPFIWSSPYIAIKQSSKILQSQSKLTSIVWFITPYKMLDAKILGLKKVEFPRNIEVSYINEVYGRAFLVNFSNGSTAIGAKVSFTNDICSDLNTSFSLVVISKCIIPFRQCTHLT